MTLFKKSFAVYWQAINSTRILNPLRNTAKKKFVRSAAKNAGAVRGEKALRERVNVPLGLFYCFREMCLGTWSSGMLRAS